VDLRHLVSAHAELCSSWVPLRNSTTQSAKRHSCTCIHVMYMHSGNVMAPHTADLCPIDNAIVLPRCLRERKQQENYIAPGG
jgi:hypothetical protein